MKRSLRSNRSSRPEKEGAENGEVGKKGQEVLQKEADNGGEEFTLDWFRDFSQSIAAEPRMNNNLL